MRYLGWILLLAAPLLAQETGGAPGAAPGAAPAADPARLFPADTFAYAEVDASALRECLPAWQVAKIVGDPALKILLGPAFTQLGVDPDKPVEALFDRVPLKEILDGRAAVGVRGMSIVVHDAMGRDWKFRVSPEHPVDARHMFRMIGMMAALDGPAGRQMTFDYDIDFLAVGRPGAVGKAWVERALEEMGGRTVKETVKVAGLDATHVVVTVPIFGGMSYAYNFYAAERDGTWFLASQTDTLEQALNGGPRTSLAASASLAQARARFTGGRPFLLAHVDLGLLVDGYRDFFPKVVKDMCDTAGINSIRGVGLGLSFVDGGLRESVGILLDGHPQGMWRILDGLPTGIRALEAAPPGALAAFAVKLDLKVLRERLLAYCAEIVPGNEGEIDREISRELSPPGMDLVKDVIPALGDEFSVFVYPARGSEVFPGFVVRTAARDEEALARLVAAVQATVPADVALFQRVELAEGVHATRVSARVPFGLHFAIHKGQLLFASGDKLLVEAATKWGEDAGPRLLRDDAMLPMVLKSLNGGDAGSLAALGYVNLRGCGTEALKALPMWGQFLPQEWFDFRGAGELHRIPDHLTGMAVALRHNKDGVALDCFSPTGVLAPAVAAAIAFSGAEVVQVAVPQRAAAGKPTLGITTKTSDGTGVKVLQLVAQGAAAAGGLQQGDKIIAFDGVAIATMEDLDRELGKKKPGETAQVKVRRGDGEVVLPVELGEEEGGW
ncbi:MAG TPA: PDZ domain-containing protein [Planctomycetota bacterium]|nr:PDZ domain-containing protein [Planctomycetota bacterium]